MQVPRIQKITLNMGVGEAKTDAKALDSAIEELTTIAGQRAQVRRARKSIASFKLREGMPIGARVTLRGARMWEFLDRLISIALPRIRDFRGLNPRSFDGRGNFSLGIREQIIFPEIDYDDDRARSAASTSRSRPPPRTTSRGSRSCARSGCRSPAETRRRRRDAVDGKKSLIEKSPQAAAVQDARVHALQPLRPRRARSTASSASAGSACGSSPTRASSRA